MRPGVPTRVWVAAVDDAGQIPARPPTVSAKGGTVSFVTQPDEIFPGAWAYTVTAGPDTDGTDVVLDLGLLGEHHTVALPVAAARPSRLRVASSVGTVSSKGPVVKLQVTAEDLPAPDALRVHLTEGTVRSIWRTDNVLHVEVQLGTSKFPRVVPVGVRDARTDDAPAWSNIRLRARPRLSMEDIDPGGSVTLTVGGRTYGPFFADEEGRLQDGWFEQYPGETQATIVQTDDLGNESTYPWPLTVQGRSALLAVPSGPQVPGDPPPAVYLYAVHGDGHPWQGRRPRCRTPAFGDLTLIDRRRGKWLVALPPPRERELQDVRLECSIGQAATTSLRVPVADNAPTRLSLRVWPQELSTDFPVAEVQVALEGARGERLPVDGVQLLAEHGDIEVQPITVGESLVLRGEYTGNAATEVGRDVLHARYYAPAGTGVVGSLRVSYDTVPPKGEVRLYGRALDLQGRPLPGVDLELSAGAGRVRATSGQDGWATANVPIPAGTGPLEVEARTPFRVARGVAVRGSAGLGGPGTPDVREERLITIDPGTTDRILVSVDPPTLYAAQRAVAYIRVRVLDSAGNPVPDDSLELEVDEGSIGPLQAEGNGSYVAEYTPDPGGPRRLVAVTARSSTGETGTGSLSLDPKPVDFALGIQLGMVTNFGQITSPNFAVTMDARTPLFGRSAMFRLGVGSWFDSAEITTGVDDPARLRLTVVPIETGLLLRREGRGRAAWVGAVGSMAPFRQEIRFGDELVANGSGALFGFGLLGGAALRFGGSELAAEAKWLQFTRPPGDVTYGGTVGGLAVGLSFRVVY